MRTRLLFLCSLLFFSQASFAQWQFGFGAVGLGPVDRFDSSVYKPGAGMFFNVMSSSFLPKTSPFEIRMGIYCDALTSGKKSFDIDLADPINAEGETVFKNSSIGNHLMTRFGYTVNPKVTVFTDLIIGHRKFTSTTRTGLKEYSDEFEDDYQQVYKTRTYRHGIGFGTRISMGKSLGLEVRADYTRGNQTTYFDLDKTIETTNSIEYASETWKHSDLFVYGIALNWKLFRIESNTTNRTDYTKPKPRTNTYNSSTRTTRTRTSTPTRSTTPKRKVTPKKDIKKVEPKKKDEPITW